MIKYILFKILIIIFSLHLLGCKGQSLKEQPLPEQDSIKLVTATSSMQEEFPQEYQAFKKQKHRFELKECRLYYNGEYLPIYDTIYKSYKLFGKDLDNLPFSTGPVLFNMDSIRNTEDWKNNIIPEKTDTNSRITRLRIYFYPDEPSIPSPTIDYVLIEGYPVGKYTEIAELNDYLKSISSKTFEEYGWGKGGVPTREYYHGKEICPTEIMDPFARNGKISDLTGIMFIGFYYKMIDGRKTNTFFYYE